MSDFFDLSVISSLTLGMLITHVYWMHVRFLKKRMERANQLERAANLLEEHYRAVSTFLEDAGASEALKEMLLDFSDSIADRRVAYKFANFLERREKLPPSADADHIVHELNQLRTHREELATAFEAAVGTGVLAMLLRWPETAKIFTEAVSQVASTPRKEIEFAASAARAERLHSPAQDAGLSAEPVLAY